MVQHRISEFVPMQETGDSIWEMLMRIGKLNTFDHECNEYKTLLNRVRMQSFCMQGISQDTTMKNTSQYRNFIIDVENILKQRQIHPLVLHCINNILPILKGDQSAQDSLRYNGNVGHGSGSIVSAFFKSQNYIDERERFAQTNPEEYARQCKFNIHGKEQGSNYHELFYNNGHRSNHDPNYVQNWNSEFDSRSQEKLDKQFKSSNLNQYPQNSDPYYKDINPSHSSNYHRDSHLNKNQHHSGPEHRDIHSNHTPNSLSSNPKSIQNSDYQNRDSLTNKGHQYGPEDSSIHSNQISNARNHSTNSYEYDKNNRNSQGKKSVPEEDKAPFVTENINQNPVSSTNIYNSHQNQAKLDRQYPCEQYPNSRNPHDTRGSAYPWNGSSQKK